MTPVIAGLWVRCRSVVMTPAGTACFLSWGGGESKRDVRDTVYVRGTAGYSSTTWIGSQLKSVTPASRKMRRTFGVTRNQGWARTASETSPLKFT